MIDELSNAIDFTKLRRDATGIWVSKEQESVSYPEQGNEDCFQIEDGSFWFEHRNRIILDLVANFPPHGYFFDIGGGNGFVSRALQMAGWQTVLVEPGSGAFNASKRGQSQVIQATLDTSGIKPNIVPSAGAFDVIEHINDHDDFTSSVHQILKPGGRFYVTVPAYRFLWSVEDVEAGHYRRYTKRSLSELLSRNDFEVEYIGYLFSFLVLPIFLLRSLPSRIGLRRSASIDTKKREHSSDRGVGSRLLNRSLSRESRKISEGKSIPFGSSVVAVARKPV